MTKKYIFILWIISMSFVSCVGQSNQQPGDPEVNLAAFKWELRQLNGTPVVLPHLNKKPFVRFSKKEKRLTGHSSCNGFFGTYTIQKNRLSFGPIGMTRMACEDVRDLEMQFMKSLAETDEFKLSGNALTFFSLGKPVAHFVGSDTEK